MIFFALSFNIWGCQSPITEVLSQKERYVVTRETVDFTLNEEFDFVFSLTDNDANLTFPEEVLVDADMPEHGHGMGLFPTTEPTETGYVAQGMLFAMEGDWSIYIYITDDEGVDQATFEVECCS